MTFDNNIIWMYNIIDICRLQRKYKDCTNGNLVLSKDYELKKSTAQMKTAKGGIYNESSNFFNWQGFKQYVGYKVWKM